MVFYTYFVHHYKVLKALKDKINTFEVSEDEEEDVIQPKGVKSTKKRVVVSDAEDNDEYIPCKMIRLWLKNPGNFKLYAKEDTLMSLLLCSAPTWQEKAVICEGSCLSNQGTTTYVYQILYL